MNERKTTEHKRIISKSGIIFCALVLLVLNFLLMNVSFAKFKDEEKGNNSAGVAGFSPIIVQDGFSGEFAVTMEDAVAGMPFTLMNDGAEVGMNVTITLSVDGVLPLSYSLYAEDEEITLTKNGNEFIAETVMSVGMESRDFVLVGKWEEDTYDERFNGLTDRVQLSVVCEQRQG